jgi:biotin carboxyl carrier protein
MFNELYEKVLEHKLLTYFKENNFNSFDLDRILAEVNRSKKLYGDFDLEKIITDVRLSKLHEQTPPPAAAAPAPAGQQAQAPPAGQKPAPAAPAPAQAAQPDPKAQAAQKAFAANAARLAKAVEDKQKELNQLTNQLRATAQKVLVGGTAPAGK